MDAVLWMPSTLEFLHRADGSLFRTVISVRYKIDDLRDQWKQKTAIARTVPLTSAWRRTECAEH